MSTVLIENANVISVSDAAALLGVTTGRVRQLLDSRKISGKKLSERAWAVELRSVEEYAKSYRKPGPKPAA